METSLKQRLLGAALLVALAVIFIPMLFNGTEREEPVTLDMDVPPEPEYTFEKPAKPEQPALTSEPERKAPKRNSMERSSPAEIARLDRPASSDRADIRPGPTPNESPAPEQTQTPRPVRAASPEPAQEGESAAKPAIPSSPVALAEPPGSQSAGKPQAADKPGPPPSPAASSPPVSTSPAAQAAASSSSDLTGWAVQVGSFSEHDNATSLRNQLRESGFAAFEEKVFSGGEPVFRVKVGPELDRARAEALQAKLTRQEQLKGIVVSHPASPDS